MLFRLPESSSPRLEVCCRKLVPRVVIVIAINEMVLRRVGLRPGSLHPGCRGPKPEMTGAVSHHESATSHGKRVSNQLPKEKHESEETPLRGERVLEPRFSTPTRYYASWLFQPRCLTSGSEQSTGIGHILGSNMFIRPAE